VFRRRGIHGFTFPTATTFVKILHVTQGGASAWLRGAGIGKLDKDFEQARDRFVLGLPDGFSIVVSAIDASHAVGLGLSPVEVLTLRNHA
jgi:hypothetical protein